MGKDKKKKVFRHFSLACATIWDNIDVALQQNKQIMIRAIISDFVVSRWDFNSTNGNTFEPKLRKFGKI